MVACRCYLPGYPPDGYFFLLCSASLQELFLLNPFLFVEANEGTDFFAPKQKLERSMYIPRTAAVQQYRTVAAGRAQANVMARLVIGKCP